MKKNASNRISTMLTAAVFLLSVCVSLPVNMLTAQAENEYEYGAIVSKEIAATTPGSWDDDTTDSKKRTQMAGTDGASEIASSYWRLFNNNEASAYFLRLNGSSSYASKVIEGKNQVYRINGHDVANYKFYSTKSGLSPRMGIIDVNSANGANLAKASSKKTASKLTYEFDFQCDYNFIDMKFYIATQFNGNDTNKDIEALKIDGDGKLYSTESDLGDANITEIAQLEKGVKYKIGFVTELIPTEAANTYNYEITVYLDGVEKYNTIGAKSVKTSKTSYYGMEIYPTPWTESEFDYTTSALKDSTEAYTAKTSLTSNGVPLSSAVAREYTIIDTDTVISDFYVYAGDIYGDVMRTYTALNELPDTLRDGEKLPAGEGEATINWISSNPDVVDIESDNIISIVDEEAFYGYSVPVTLTANISNESNGETKTKTLDVKIRRNTDAWTPQQYADYDAHMPFSYLTNQNQDAVVSPITLPAESESGSTLTWSITKSGAATLTETDTEYVLTFVPQSKGTTSLTLTVTANYNGVTSSNEFKITVIKSGYSADEVYLWEDTLTEGSYDVKINFEDDSIIKTNETWPFTDDGQGIVPKTVNDRPVVIVGPFDDAIFGFEIDTALQKVGGKCATDFMFEASADGTVWDEIPSYYTFKEDERVPEGNAVWTVVEHIFSPAKMDVSKDYRYLKIIFGDASRIGRYIEAAGLDGIKIYFATDVTKAYNALDFSDLSAEKIDAVNNNLTLPDNGAEGTAISWISSNEEVIAIGNRSNNGYFDAVVDEDAFYGYSIPVTLTAIISKTPETETSGADREKVFNITVVRDTDGWSAQDYVDYDINNLTFDYLTEQPQNMVAANIHLPKGVEGGGGFTWSVTNPDGTSTSAAEINNYVLSFTPQKGAVTPLTLTVTSAKDGAVATRDFPPIEVVRGFSDNLILAADVSASTGGIRKALSRDVVTYWETAAGDSKKTVYIEFAKETQINSGLIVEAGENISTFTLEVSEDDKTWETAFTGKSNGNLVREAFAFDAVKCKYAKITFSSVNPIKIATLELYNDIVTDEQAMELSLKELAIPSRTTTDLTLPDKGAYIGTITWISSDSNVIEIEGYKAKVKRKLNENKSVTLTATLEYPPYPSKTESFNVSVPGIITTGASGNSGKSGLGGGGASGGTVAAKDFEESLPGNTQQASGRNSFADVPEEHWVYSYVTDLVSKDVISAAENYRPSDFVTREEFVKLMIACIGDFTDEPISTGFTDTDATAWYYPYIAAAQDMGIVKGNADGSFGIGECITRQDAAAMLYRAIAPDTAEEISSTTTFTDGTAVSVYAAEAVAYLANAQIINGYEDGSFRPFNNLTRAESAKIIYMLSTLAKEDSNA